MAYTIDSTLADLLADPKIKPTLEQYLPGITTNPQVALLKGFSLRMVISNPLAAQFGINEAQVERLLNEVNKIAG